jgi:drug/metabolite transporter (DMT)-like permease
MSVAAIEMPSARVRTAPLLIVAAGGALTGFSGLFVRISEVDPVATGAWRLLFAAIALMPFLPTGRGDLARGAFSPVLIAAGLCFAVDMGFFNSALSFTSIAHATLIVNLAPIVALAAGFLLFGEGFGPAKALGLIAAVGGAALMTATRDHGGGTLLGNGIAAIGMLGYAFYLVAVKRARRDHDTVSIMLWSSVTAAAAMFVVAALMGERILPLSLSGWAVLVAFALVSHVLGQGLVAFGMREAPVGLASILLLTQPIVAAVAAWAVFGESMGPVETAGAVTVLLGLAIASRARR